MKIASAFFLEFWGLHMMPPWLQGPCVLLSWLQTSWWGALMSAECSNAPRAWLPLLRAWLPMLVLCSLCLCSHDHLWFLSWGRKPSLGKKVLPWPSSFISVVCSQMSYWSGAGSLEHCFQTAETEAAWKGSDETRMIITVSYEAFLQSQPGRDQWVAKAWLRDRTEKMPPLQVS